MTDKGQALGQLSPLGPPGTCAHMEHFLETCLLLLIDETPDHGYSLLERLGEFGFPTECLNVGTLYRTLRRLEEEGLANSDWEEGGQGPRRRVYTITEKGKATLATWIQIIRGNKARIERLLARYASLEELDGEESDSEDCKELDRMKGVNNT